jgi:hypothetical protein
MKPVGEYHCLYNKKGLCTLQNYRNCIHCILKGLINALISLASAQYLILHGMLQENSTRWRLAQTRGDGIR